METTNTFHWVDYLVFSLMFVVSAAIGIFYAYRDKRRQNTANFLLGGRQMSFIPVSLSLLASFLSAISVLGQPSEVYYNGTMIWLSVFATMMAYPVTANVFMPVFHSLQVNSAYEYLQLRFNTGTRVLGSVLFQIETLLYMGIVLYAPAIALNQVMGIDMLVSILATGGVCIFYTTLGGLKAVIWTDVFQTVVMLAGLVAVVALGTGEVGGFSKVWDTAVNGDKIEFNNFDPSPLVRHTVWSVVIGGFFAQVARQAANQTMIQRYLSMNTIKEAKRALYLQVPFSILSSTLLTFTGLVLYARYHDNDPLKECNISKQDQMVPWLVMDALGGFHGIPGLIVACIFSASLSTISSGVNSLALVFLVDIYRPLYMHMYNENLSERQSTIIAKLLGVLYGGVAIGLAFSVKYFGPLILQVGLSLFGMVGGPLFGMFVCAMFFPIVNSLGVTVGVVVGLGLNIWVTVGSLVYNAKSEEECIAPGNGTTTPSPYVTDDWGTSPIPDPETGFFANLYSLSYQWYSCLGLVFTVVFAILVSCLSGGTRGRPVDQRLLSPLYLKLHRLSQLKRENISTRDATHTLSGYVPLD